MCRQLRLVGEDDPWAADGAFLLEVLLAAYERRRSQREVVNEMPLYPTEGLLWDESQVRCPYVCSVCVDGRGAWGGGEGAWGGRGLESQGKRAWDTG